MRVGPRKLRKPVSGKVLADLKFHRRLSGLLTRLSADDAEAMSTLSQMRNDVAKIFSRKLVLCLEKAEEENSWEFMVGAYKQAMDIYCIASIMYYTHDNPLMSDDRFDMLCQFLRKHFSGLDSAHAKDRNITIGDLRAGTGYRVKPDILITQIVNLLLLMLKETNGTENSTTQISQKPKSPRIKHKGGLGKRVIRLRRSNR